MKFIVMNNRGRVCCDPYNSRADAQSFADQLNSESSGDLFFWVIEVESETITRCGLGFDAASGCY